MSLHPSPVTAFPVSLNCQVSQNSACSHPSSPTLHSHTRVAAARAPAPRGHCSGEAQWTCSTASPVAFPLLPSLHIWCSSHLVSLTATACLLLCLLHHIAASLSLPDTDQASVAPLTASPVALLPCPGPRHSLPPGSPTTTHQIMTLFC